MIVRCLAVIMMLLFQTRAAWAADRLPNIVLILADDLGWPHLGCYGSDWFETPHIDRLAAEGMRFTDHYAAGAVCSPTRASIQSGQYQARLGITDYIPGHKYPFERLQAPPIADHLPLEIVTPAELMKSAGYVTGYFGKWHLGNDATQGPARQGYDDVIVTGGRHFAPRFHTTPAVEIAEGTYLGDFLTEQTINFMTQNKDRPFFVQLSHFLVHIPLEAKTEAIEKFRNKPQSGEPMHPTYGAMVQHLDESVGRVIHAVEALGLRDDTLIFFTSDNGGLRQSANGGEVVSHNAPLRNEKGSLYEGGIRVPLIIRWPGVVAEGSVCSEPTMSIDFWPTIAEISGVNDQWRSAFPSSQSPDGLSLVPLLTRRQQMLLRDALFFHYPHYHHSRPAGAIRTRDWKLIEFFDTGRTELYRISTDVSETQDVSADEPAVAKQLQHKLTQWRKDVMAKMPTTNPTYDPQRAKMEP